MEMSHLNRHVSLLVSSFFQLTGKHLIDPRLSEMDQVTAVLEAEFAIVSHNAAVDPIFNFGNKVALNLFELTWAEFIKLPSRRSAEPHLKEERDRLLSQVAEKGFIDDYTGVRVSATGKRFLVNNAVVWNLIDERDHYWGQAAVLYSWIPL